MVSIIILSYNTSKLLSECLTSVEKVLKNYDYELIVVDNLSHDDSVEMVKKQFPTVKLIENTENAGFARGCNLGATHAKGEYLLFLNSDTQMSENPLAKMVEIFEKNEKVGVVGGRLINFDGSLQRSYGPFYGLAKVCVMLFGGEKAELRTHPSDNVKEVDWVSGGFMMVRRSVFDIIHGFDGRYFMYIEDMDLCYRVRKKGYLVFHTPEAVVKHLGQGSSNKSFAIINIFKGLRLFYKKHRSKLSYIILEFLLTIKSVLALTVGLLKGNQNLINTYRKTLTNV